VLSGDHAGRGQILNTLRAALAQEQRSENHAQRNDHAAARERLRAQHSRFPGIEQWLRDQGQEAVAEQWRYRESARESIRQSAAIASRLDLSLYTRFAAEWSAQYDVRRDARERAWLQYARDVARLKNASKQRWAAVRLVAKGRIAGKLWALSARMADQQAWRRLHQRHRAALRAADEQTSMTATPAESPMRSAANALTAEGRTTSRDDAQLEAHRQQLRNQGGPRRTGTTQLPEPIQRRKGRSR
jgi:hypothetical protein